MQQLNEIVEEKAKEILVKFITNGGEMVSNENYEARRNLCLTRKNGNPCEYFGAVEPVAGVVFSEGCKKCNCPTITKAKMKQMDGLMGYFLGHEVKCSHQDGNLWAAIDAQFK